MVLLLTSMDNLYLIKILKCCPKGNTSKFWQDQTSYAGLDLASFQKQACLLLRRIQLFMPESSINSWILIRIQHS
jgi:hypothetical protein